MRSLKKKEPAGKGRRSAGLREKDIKKRVVRRAVSNISPNKRAEAAEKNSEALFRLLFENSADGILLTHPDGEFYLANPEACRMLGRTEEEIKKLGRAGIVDKKDPRLPAALEERRRTSKFRGELNLVKKDGVAFPGDISTKIFKDSSGNDRTIMIIRDLTERKRAEEELWESEEKLRVLFEQLPIGVTLLDQNRKMIYANPALEKILDISRDDLFKDKYQNRRYLRPDGTSMPPEEYASVRAFQKQQPVHDVETGVITESGKTIWTSVSATPFPVAGKGVVIATVDITERKRAEEAVRKSEEKYRGLTENINLGIYRNTVGPEGKFIEANPAIIGMFGYKNKEEFLAINVSDLYQNPEDRNKFNDKMLKEGFVRSEELWLKMKDGSLFVGSVSAVAVKDEQGHVKYYDGIIDNITERKQAEETLRKSQSNLRALTIELSHAEDRERQRLASFLHDEIGQTLALLRIKFGGLTGAWRSKSGKQSIQQIRDLLEKVIDQTHTLTFELSPPILHQLGLEAAIEWAGEKISQDNGIEFTFRDDGMMKPLDADLKALLFRCVRELMMNIVKHAKARRMTVSSTRTEERVFVVVEDDGIGFNKSLLEQQLDMIGFGLFSTRERLAAVGGTFELRSEPGRGTRVALSVLLKEEMPSS